MQGDDFEKMMLNADGLLKKSQGFLLFAIDQSGEFQSILNLQSLSSPVTIGLCSMSQMVLDQAIDIQMGNYTMNVDGMGEQSLGNSQFGNEDDLDTDDDEQ